MIRFIDLFAGLGGIRLGFENAMDYLGVDHQCVFTSEIKPYAIEAYKGYYGQDESIYGDITTVSDVNNIIPDFDILLAGFPCQPFSSAGNRKGFTDTRGTLFFEIERILRAKIDSGHPAEGFLLENVEGLENHDHGRTLAVILEHLRNLGYHTVYAVLDAKNFGLAQSRKRVYIVGSLHETISLTDFRETHATISDIMEHGRPLVDSHFTRCLLSHYQPEQVSGRAIKDKRGGNGNIHSWDIGLKGEISPEEKSLLNKLLTERRKKQWADVIGIKWMDGMPLTSDMIKTFWNVPDLDTMLKHLTSLGYLTYEHPKQQEQDENGNPIRVPDTSLPKGYNIVAGKLSFEFTKILDPDGIAPTLVAMDVSKLGVVDGPGIRRLTIRECQRLCGYPDNYDLSFINEKDAFDLLGNTVCVPVIEKISERIGESYLQNQTNIPEALTA